MGIENANLWKCDSCGQTALVPRNANPPYPNDGKWITLEMLAIPNTVSKIFCKAECVITGIEDNRLNPKP